MKRIANLFERIIDRDNLRLAVSKAVRGKRGRPEVIAFLHNLDGRLAEMAEQLHAGTFPLGRYRQFLLFDPKERIISAPCFAERVLHHAVMNVCEPAFERWLIADTFACRTGKGRLAALERARSFCRRFPFYLKLDIRKYFDSVPHDLLLARLGRLFKDRRLMELLQTDRRLVPGRARPRLADRQPDLAALRQFLPGLVRPLRQGAAAHAGATSATWMTWSCGPRPKGNCRRPWLPARDFWAQSWA